MAVNDPTTFYGWDLPVDGGSTDAWGTLWNEMVAEEIGALIESMDTVIFGLSGDVGALENRESDLDARTDALTNTPAYARVYRTAAAAQTAEKDTPLVLSWDTEVYDVGGLFDFATNPEVFSIPVGLGGLYEIRVVTEWDAFNVGDNGYGVELRIKKNGTIIADSFFPFMNNGHADDSNPSPSGDRSLMVATLDEASAFDEYSAEIKIFVDVGQAEALLNTNDGDSTSYFQIVRFPSPVVTTEFVQSGAIDGHSALASHLYTTGEPSGGDMTLADGDLHVVAWVAPFTGTIDELACGTSFAGTGTGNLRFVIYDTDEAVGTPGSKLYESGNFNVNPTATALVATSVATPVIEGHIYWLGVITDTTVDASLAGFTPVREFFMPRGVPGMTWAEVDVAPNYEATGQSFPAPDPFPASPGSVSQTLKISAKMG